MEANILEAINPAQLGAELQRARKRAGMTQEEAAKIIAAARTTLVAIEKGERRIKASELLKLARAYGRPLSDFVGSLPPMEAFDVQFRGPFVRTEEDERAIEPCIREFEGLCRNYLELERITQSPLPRKYPAAYSLQGLPSEQAAENIAMEERHRLNLGDGPLPILRDILEQDVGLRVFFLEMPSRFSEMYYYSDLSGGCLAINLNHPEERRRWSMAHGYAHFLTSRYQPFVSQERPYQRVPESERFADAFAMFFLMPTSGLTRRYNDLRRTKEKVMLGDLCTLAHYYQVSLEALVRRLEGLKLVKAGIADAIKQGGFKVGEAKKQLGLDENPAIEDRLPARYQYLALIAFREEQIGEGAFARLLGVDRLEARRIARTLQQSVPPLGREDERMRDVSASAGV